MTPRTNSFSRRCFPLLGAILWAISGTSFGAPLDIIFKNEGTTNLDAAEKLVSNQVITTFESIFKVPLARNYEVTIIEADLGAGTVGSNSAFQEDRLGNPIASTIKVNTNAAVTPFYVDPTPATNDNFTLMGGIYQANGSTAPDGKWDLLTLVAHELGHAMGFGGAGGVWNRFASRLGGTGNKTYLGENGFTFATTDQDHTSSAIDLLGDPGFGKSQRQYLNSTPEIAALFDAFDYGTNKLILDKAGSGEAIADNTTTTFELVVNQKYNIKDLDIALYLKHPNDGDLEISLKGPDGTSVLLADNRGGSGDDFGSAAKWTRFDDEGRMFPVTTAAASFLGTHQPENMLSAFDGKSTMGKWILEIKDTAAGDAGTFQGFTLIALVPEPSAFSMGAIFAGVLTLFRRRR